MTTGTTAEGERWALPSLKVRHKVAVETTGRAWMVGSPIALPTELKRRSGFLVCQQFARLVETFGADHDGQERPGGYVLRLIWIQAKRMSAMMSEPIA